MPSEKEEKYMETKKATIRREQCTKTLLLQVQDMPFEIILTDDNPNNVKSVFNNLIQELKKGEFQFKLEDDTLDLYHQICEEYLKQLNAELSAIYIELQDLELIQL